MAEAPDTINGLFGHPPPKLAAAPPEPRQFSPLSPGAASLENASAGSLASMTMLAAPGTLERQFDIAAMLSALAPGAPFTVLAPKTLGGTRLYGELAALGCESEENAKAHHRICRGACPPTLDGPAIQQAIEAGAPRRLATLGLWSQPGIFSWDSIDAGTALLAESLPRGLAGRGADFGCGFGFLAHAVLASPDVTRLDMLDVDRRAIEAARRNVDDPRVRLTWADVRAGVGLSELDFAVTNPPFHAGGHEDRSLGQLFIRRIADSLRRGGRLWLVANRHLPYEAALAGLFGSVVIRYEAHGYKVIEAVR
jgi:16S rRNA (guanine1207-N2)-methyltransferase